MNNDELTDRIADLQKRMTALEAHCYLPVTPPSPVIPPPAPPGGGSQGYDHDLDMSVSNHVDTVVEAGQIVVFRFRFTAPVKQSMCHFTAIDLITGPCWKMAIDKYGYESEDCRVEMSNDIGTDDEWSNWVVPKNEYIFLKVINTEGPGTLRLSWNGENTY